ncbi:MAG: LCP family protein [Lachnospiraceae bacterium]|nr:LCP family protein [Lachnospiraceae bacterium]
MRGQKQRDPSGQLHNALYFLSGVMSVILVLILVVGVQTKAQNNRNMEDASGAVSGEDEWLVEATKPVTESEENVEKWQEGIVTYEGRDYRYNTSIHTYLMMGIDKDEPVAPAKDYISGGQSDAMFLLVVDTDNQKLKVISINRNAMTDIEVYDEGGYSMGTMEGQICLQHAYGDGKKLSCMRSVDAVAKMFGNIPISGYLAMNMGGIPLMNDAIGGVELTALQSISLPDQGVSIKKGETLTLNGTEAYYYLRGRDTEEFGSATKRLRREEQYIIAYMDKLKRISGGNAAGVVDIYDSISDYLVTSVDFTSLITELMDYGFSQDQLYTVPGEMVLGEPVNGQSYEEYRIDEDAMKKLIMDVFYQPVS